MARKRRGQFAVPSRRAWPLNTRERAMLAIEYMELGRGRRSDYPAVRRALRRMWGHDAGVMRALARENGPEASRKRRATESARRTAKPRRGRSAEDRALMAAAARMVDEDRRELRRADARVLRKIARMGRYGADKASLLPGLTAEVRRRLMREAGVVTRQERSTLKKRKTESPYKPKARRPRKKPPRRKR